MGHGERRLQVLSRLGRSQQSEVQFQPPVKVYGRQHLPVFDLFRNAQWRGEGTPILARNPLPGTGRWRPSPTHLLRPCDSHSSAPLAAPSRSGRQAGASRHRPGLRYRNARRMLRLPSALTRPWRSSSSRRMGTACSQYAGPLHELSQAVAGKPHQFQGVGYPSPVMQLLKEPQRLPMA